MSLEVHAFENDMGARPTRKKTRIAERRENLVVSLSVSFIARAPRFDPHQKRTRWSLSNSLSTPIQNGRRIQIQMNSNSCARELDIPTEFRRDTTRSEQQRQQQQKEEDERKERDEFERAPSHDFLCCAKRRTVSFVERELENSKGRKGGGKNP